MIAHLFEPATAAWIAKHTAIALGVLLAVLGVQGVRRRARENDR